MATSSERSRPVENTETTLEEALKSNLALQAAVTAELEQLAGKKADNRRKAAHLLQELSRTWEQSDRASAPPVPKNSYRQWKRHFFSGKDGSTPGPNPDVVRRRTLESQTFLHHLQPPWSAKDDKVLGAVVKEIQATASSTAEIDFDRVSQLLNERLDRPADSILKPRTALECRTRYTQMHHKVLPFSKEESRTIFEKVHLHDGHPDWEALAASLPNERTAWECLVAYQTKLCPTVQQQQAWTTAEDQLLLQYVAAAGPQFVIDGDAMVHLAARLLPGRSRKQILARVNQSILNPNLHRDAWSDEEERRLTICMKVYSNTPNDLYRAAAHLPHRANKSVVEKWQRSLNPEHSSRPFTKQEDRAFLAAARANPEQGWTELARRHCPDRHPQRLAARWSELASDQDILARSGESIVKQRAKRSFGVNADEDARLNLDDFVVQVQKKTK